MISFDKIMEQIQLVDGGVKSIQSGKMYTVDEFVTKIAKANKLTKKERNALLANFIDIIRPQSENSIYVENFIDKYDVKFCGGVYSIKNDIYTLDELYRYFWKGEKLLPTEFDKIVEDLEKICETKDLQEEIFKNIVSRRVDGASEYLAGLDVLYPNNKFREIIHNIIVPNSNPLFHIFYDDGTGGTGKSTFLEVITKLVGENFVSNVLLDQFANRFVFAEMLGKYANIGDDNGKSEELANCGTLKSIITQNRVTVDRKNLSPLSVRIFAKQLYATNIFPYIDFTDGGFMRRLNVVEMGKKIPKDMKLCEFDNDEIGRIINECLYADDLIENNNSLAIEKSPLFRFSKEYKSMNYESYIEFCKSYGFNRMNITNFENKLKFIEQYKKLETPTKQITFEELTEVDEMPF